MNKEQLIEFLKKYQGTCEVLHVSEIDPISFVNVFLHDNPITQQTEFDKTERPKITQWVKAVKYRFKYLTKKEMNEMQQYSKQQIYESIDIMLDKIYNRRSI